ncbi:hypothetical protein [Burkholderia cenocepacia]|uniref:hypothetical protein n=1 Tax=Burkholderia cenocepacia TaxID=95486 RepID=UPI002ABE2AE0|nr:hypothetical protein [Burkholderia cenocepacia]
MAITNENINFKDYAYRVDLANSGALIVDRHFALKTGETVSIHVSITSEEGSDLKAINENSIRRAIEILQAWLPKTE